MAAASSGTMATTHRDSLRNELAALTVGKVDLGTGHPSGRIVLFAADGSICSTATLPNPAFLAPVGGIAYPAGPIPDDTAPVVGKTPVRYEVQDRDWAWVFRGNVGPSADWGDIGTPFEAGQPVRYANFLYRAPI